MWRMGKSPAVGIYVSISAWYIPGKTLQIATFSRPYSSHRQASTVSFKRVFKLPPLPRASVAPAVAS